MDPKEIRSKLGLAEDAKAREVRKALKAYMSEDKGTDDEKSALARAVAEMDEESETDVGKSQVSAKAAESAEAMALIDKLTARVEKAETDAYYAKAEQLQDRKTAKEVLALAGGNTSNALAILAKMPKQPNTTSALARRMFQGGDPMSGQTTKTTDDDDGDNIRPSANRQFTLTQCNLASKAKALAEAKNISIEQATYEVAKKHPELAQRAQ